MRLNITGKEFEEILLNKNDISSWINNKLNICTDWCELIIEQDLGDPIHAVYVNYTVKQG